MKTERRLPALSAPRTTTDTGSINPDGASLAHARGGDDAPGMGHNILTPDQADVMRASIRRIQSIQRQIDALNRDKAAVYDALRNTEVDPALVRKVVYRLGLSGEEIDAIAQRDAKLAAYWRAVADLREDADGDQPSSSPDGSLPSSNGRE
ncbi:MAG: hypothetical protein RLY86_658 [Pseudomonadota bacterium]|jgi:uncharacterized protein (UPF0335 family)